MEPLIQSPTSNEKTLPLLVQEESVGASMASVSAKNSILILMWTVLHWLNLGTNLFIERYRVPLEPATNKKPTNPQPNNRSCLVRKQEFKSF